MDLSGKTILVTGAASGIGRATVSRCKQAGARLVATDLSSVDAIRDNDALDSTDLALELDVGDELAVEAVINQSVEKCSKLDGVVNCAGIHGLGSAHEIDLQDWDRVFRVHVSGTLNVCKHALRAMLPSNNGSIVNISSIFGMTGGEGNMPYNSAKGAVLQMTRSMAADYGRSGIRVNTVSPGYIETPMTEVVGENPFAERFVNMHLLKRAGKPEEVACAIAFLLSDEASFITGANLPVDGGFSAAQVFTA